VTKVTLTKLDKFSETCHYYLINKTSKEDTMETITKTQTLIQFVAQAAVLAKDAKKAATEAFTRAEADAIDTMVANDTLTIMLPNDTRVTVEGLNEVRRSIDVEALEALVPATVLRKVTKVAIDLSAFDAAVEAGLIDAETVAAVTGQKPVKPSLRITAKAAK